jgi:hypothetical protein
MEQVKKVFLPYRTLTSLPPELEARCKSLWNRVYDVTWFENYDEWEWGFLMEPGAEYEVMGFWEAIVDAFESYVKHKNIKDVRRKKNIFVDLAWLSFGGRFNEKKSISGLLEFWEAAKKKHKVVDNYTYATFHYFYDYDDESFSD